MKSYRVDLEVTTIETVIVKADDPSKAKSLAVEQYESGDITPFLIYQSNVFSRGLAVEEPNSEDEA